MSQITIKTSKEHRVGKSVIIGGIEVKFDSFGMCEVPERYLEGILNADDSISLVDDADVKKFADIKKKSEIASKSNLPNIDVIDKTDELKVEIEGLKLTNKTLTEENIKIKEELEAALTTISELEVEEKETTDVVEEVKVEETEDDIDIDNMKKDDLKELCKGLEFPEEEWSTLKIDELKIYVQGKI